MEQKQLDWYNEGIALLMAVMNGRDIPRDSAERVIFNEWRKRSQLCSEITK